MLSRCGFECFEAGDDVVVLGLSTETISTISTRSTGVAFIALGTLGTISAGSVLVALRPLRTRIAVIALRGLSETSSLNAVQVGRSDRGPTLFTISQLVRLKCH